MKTSISEKITMEGLTFDDILLLPDYSDFKRNDINLSAKLTKKITLKSPFVSAPMDTVTESRLAIELARQGGIGIIHRNLTIEKEVEEVKKVKKENLLVGAATGAHGGFENRAKALITAGVDILVLDSAHGFTKTMIEAITFLKKKYKTVQIMAGNVATYDGAKALVQAGADALRVGMGPGAICTTRIVSGMGVPQITALFETVKAAQTRGIPVVADGGIKSSGDMVKALAAGASTIMMGSFFASCEESPGDLIQLKKDQVPRRFKSIFKQGQEDYLFKSYRGMGSVAAMKKGAQIKSEDEFHGKDYTKDRVLVAEGVEALVPVHGKLKNVLTQAIGGIKSGMYYVGAQTIEKLHKKTRFIKITQASLVESHPHDVLITNSGESYK